MDQFGEAPEVKLRKRSNSVTSVENYRINEVFEGDKNTSTEQAPHPNTPVSDFIESVRLQTKKILTHSRFGRIYENFLLFLSVVSCLEYIYQTYLHPSVPSDKKLLHDLNILELYFASMFGFDWLLNCFLAEHRLIFFTR
jgi:hypothetical protein